ncbi:uncharacterized protein LOC123536531 [Mercenaria mercenaria]|uniref:uncharacterized protein LOC123536531 n=1 Tax=Mercenaria mercenaria TaxID=6596 RepID=UPI00234F3E00|nr:uncharacterized protein LOC123536531 [Mercenaria mercenaria]
MDKIDSFHDIISDLPEGFKPISPEPDLVDEQNNEHGEVEDSSNSSLLQPGIEDDFTNDQSTPKRKLSRDINDLSELDRHSNSVGHSPPKIERREVSDTSFPGDFHGAFDIHSESQISTQTFSPLNTSVNQLSTISTLAAVPVPDINTSVSNEAEDIVRKLCKNGKVMEFQEGEDFIKVIVYEDSEEDSDKENNPRFSNKQRVANATSQPGCSLGSEQTFCPPTQILPTSEAAMAGIPMDKQMLHHTPHPRNGYMFYNHDGTPTLADQSTASAKLRKTATNTSTPSTQMNFGFGVTPVSNRTNVPLNSSGEENTSPTEPIHTPTSQQLQNRVRSLINLPQYQFIDDNGKIREQHNQKERRRRARIKEACNLLRQLVPGMSDKTDKATVFEFAARYVHFLKSHTGAQFDKDFLMKYSPY